MNRVLSPWAPAAAFSVLAALGAARMGAGEAPPAPPEGGERLRGIVERDDRGERAARRERSIAAARTAWAGARAVARFPAGEELRYSARVYKGARWLGKDVGDAVFRVSRETVGGREAYRIAATASGGGFGYRLDTRIESLLAADDGAPLRYTYVQSGSEERARRLDFSPGRVEYWKREHCDRKGCRVAAHRLGSHHCDLDDDECDRPTHQVWRRRSVHEGHGAAYDMLSSVYIARGLDIRPGFRETIRVVETHAVYDVAVSVVGQETIETEAGRFQTYCVALEPRLVSTTKKRKKDEKFRGLFGLTGSIRIWLDKRTRTPVRVEGTIPFGIDLNGRIDLASRKRAA